MKSVTKEKKDTCFWKSFSLLMVQWFQPLVEQHRNYKYEKLNRKQKQLSLYKMKLRKLKNMKFKEQEAQCLNFSI